MNVKKLQKQGRDETMQEDYSTCVHLLCVDMYVYMCCLIIMTMSRVCVDVDESKRCHQTHCDVNVLPAV